MPTADEAPWQKLLGDPLREITRKERRTLLGVSVIAILVAKTGILPHKIESIGIELLSDSKPVVLLTLAAVVLYFLIAFVTYAASDLIAWQRSYFELKDHLEFEETKRQYEAEEKNLKNVVIGISAPPPRWLTGWQHVLHKAVLPMSVLRALVEFVLPLGVGTFSLVSLIVVAYR
jgi:hypothetical protein